MGVSDCSLEPLSSPGGIMILLTRKVGEQTVEAWESERIQPKQCSEIYF